MRYYKIQIYQPDKKTLVREITSHPTKNARGMLQYDPGALNVVIDAFVNKADAAYGYPYLQIWGLSLQDISQATDLANHYVKVFGGFQAGLPLNKPRQAGLIFEGRVYQSFGNWIGTDQTLDVYLTAESAVPRARPIVFSWLANTALSDALTAALNQAFPDANVIININPLLALNHDEHGYYPDLHTFAQVMKKLTSDIIGGVYSGIDIAMQPGERIVISDGPPLASNPPAGQSFVVPGNDPKLFLPTTQGGYEGTATKNPDGTYTVQGNAQQVVVDPTAPSASATPVQIAFEDLIGQTTWIAPNTIQVTFVMRADLNSNTIIQMPKGLLGDSSNPGGSPGAVFTTVASMPLQRQKGTFSGKFQVTSVHHVGQFRVPSGDAWATIITAVTSGS